MTFKTIFSGIAIWSLTLTAQAATLEQTFTVTNTVEVIDRLADGTAVTNSNTADFFFDGFDPRLGTLEAVFATAVNRFRLSGRLDVGGFFSEIGRGTISAESNVAVGPNLTETSMGRQRLDQNCSDIIGTQEPVCPQVVSRSRASTALPSARFTAEEWAALVGKGPGPVLWRHTAVATADLERGNFLRARTTAFDSFVRIIYVFEPAPVPLPASSLLLATVLVGLAVRKRRSAALPR